MITLPKNPLASLPVKTDDDFFDTMADVVGGEYEEDSDIKTTMHSDFWDDDNEPEDSAE